MNTNARNIGIFLKKDFILSFKNSIILAIAYLLTIPVIRGISNLNTLQSAQCLEQSVALVGMIVIIPITKWELETGIQEVIFTKSWSYIKTVIIRLLCAFFLMIFMILGFSTLMLANNCSFPFWKFSLGSILISLFMGMLGLLFAQITENVLIGYLTAFGYYSLCKLEVLSYGDLLYLFPLTRGVVDNTILPILVLVNMILLLLFMIRIKKHGVI